MLLVDGGAGEGGGQVLRTALGLSLVTRTPFRIVRIRARRSRPGLLRQHLTAVEAAARVGDARVNGAELGSRELTFRPREVRPGSYTLSVGSAGSTTLVLQTVLPALSTAREASSLILEGGTHNLLAPPYDFLERAFLPLLSRLGVRAESRLERHGFYPAGGGRVRVELEPATSSRRLDLLDRGRVRNCRARALVANLPMHIAERELSVVSRGLSWSAEALESVRVDRASGPGNVLLLEVESERVTEVFTGFGRRGVRAEDVAWSAVRAAQRYLEAGVPVGDHLADQLLIPLALAGGGSYLTLPLSSHAVTNIEVLRMFLDVPVERERVSETAERVEVGGVGDLR